MPKKEEPKLKKVVVAADGLSLGISMVVAILIGVGLGLLLKNLFGYAWLLWLGVFWGISAAILNVYKAYSKQYQAFEELRKSGRYKIQQQLEDDEDEDESAKNY